MLVCSVADLATSPRVGVFSEPAVVQLSGDVTDDVAAAAAHAADLHPAPLIGVAEDALPAGRHRLAEALDFTLTPADTDRWGIHVDDPWQQAEAAMAQAHRAPHAAAAFVQVLRASVRLDLASALRLESFAYSTLLGSGEFRRWRATTRVATQPPSREPVAVQRDGDTLRVWLDRPGRRNALDQSARDALASALDIALADPDLQVELRGEGPVFCSGGDLGEFGSAEDLAVAHDVRTVHGPAVRLGLLAGRTTAHVHGACVGAGVELAAFAGRVVAVPGTTFRLPEVAMGLIPGAGGTVSVSRRVGRWRTAWLGLTGTALEAPTAYAWGLVDVVEASHPASGGYG